VTLGAIMSVLDTTIVNDTLGHGAHRAVPLPPLS
jgi:hypothetical protein